MIMSEREATVLKTRVVHCTEDWDAIENDWGTLYEASPWASPPLHFDWLRTWWRIYCAPSGAAGLRIVTVWRHSQLIGVAPLYVDADSKNLPPCHVRFISTGEAEHEETCPDYMNILCLAGEEEACAAAVWAEIDLMG